MSYTQDVPANLGWLADAPLFINSQLVASFYDAVARPPGEIKLMRYNLASGFKAGVGATLGLSAEANTGEILAKLAGWFPSLMAKATVEGQATATTSRESQEEIVIESIDTPQRQLIQLCVHYLLNYPDRLFIVRDIANDNEWRSPQIISNSPRALVFLDLPRLNQAHQAAFPPTCLIPTAAEFENSGIKLLYRQVGEKAEPQPDYPSPKLEDGGKVAQKEYWKWFFENFDPTKAMTAIEAAAPGEKIRWIDFRVPLTYEGDTIHLHISPRSTADTGDFAYNLVKRGYKHGLRIVGTVKSEPSINVLAIYEK